MDELRRGGTDAVLVHVLHDADNFAPDARRIGCGFANPLADGRGGIAPQLTRETLGNDSDLAAVVDVGPRQIAARDEARANGRKVIRRDIFEPAYWRRASRRMDLILDV